MLQFFLIFFYLVGIKTVLGYIYNNFKSVVAVIISLFKENVYPRKKINILELYGNWAVITGSTDGIGKTYAIELAKKGLDIILISRSKEKLIETSNIIENKFNVQCKYIEADFSRGKQVYEHIRKELKNFEIGILINNVGQAYEYPELFCNVNEDKIWNMLLLNIGATAMMTRLVGNQMISRKRGLIVNIGSICQDLPGPYFNMYAAGKAFVKSFTLALQWELNDYNIDVQLLNPAFIRTNMTNFSKNLRKTNFFVADVKKFTKSAVWTLGRTNETTGYINHGIQFGVGKLFPVTLQIFVGQLIAKMWHNEYLKKVIRTLTGEPNYRSVNLTWEVEIPQLNMTDQQQNSIFPFPKTFQIYFCELQSFVPHRCRSKVVQYNETDEDNEFDSSTKYYTATVENLRMATKYSFHIKPQIKRKIAKITGRMGNMQNEVEPESLFSGQTIVIPTKGFSAEATKCLPHASEIKVETGPYFGGKIVVDGSHCGIKGDPKSTIDTYIMRIDHQKCGSLVKPETNTVETFITVQENLGIFTHSTRRFVVVCTFQSGQQTVRASFTVPGKGGVVASVNEENDPFEPDTRNGRNRKFKYVDKTHLILKENNNETEIPTEPNETDADINDNDAENVVAILENIVPDTNESDLKSLMMNSEDMLGIESQNIENIYETGNSAINRQAKFARLINENIPQNVNNARNSSTNYTTGILIAASLSVIMIGVFIFVVKREIKRQSQACKRRIDANLRTNKKPVIVIKNP